MMVMIIIIIVFVFVSLSSIRAGNKRMIYSLKSLTIELSSIVTSTSEK